LKSECDTLALSNILHIRNYSVIEVEEGEAVCGAIPLGLRCRAIEVVVGVVDASGVKRLRPDPSSLLPML
jgi:hypothetical protein